MTGEQRSERSGRWQEALGARWREGFYHVTARGNRRERIFLDDDDRRFFLATLGEACGLTGWRVHAWVRMSNHYHLFIETPKGTRGSAELRTDIETE